MSFAIRPTNCKRCGKSLSMFEGRYCLECQKEIDKELEIYEGNTGVFDEPYPWRPDEIIGILKHIIEVADTNSCGVKEIDGIDEEAINNAITIIGSFEQIKWERDTAIAQLKELGYEFGEKIRTDDDLISREELLKAIDTWDKFGYTETGCFVREPKNDYVPYIHYDDVIKCIKGMPPFNPQEPKTGHWILGVCDECGYDWGKDAPIASVPNFCPNCGCRMVEPQESEGTDADSN